MKYSFVFGSFSYKITNLLNVVIHKLDKQPDKKYYGSSKNKF